MSRAVFQPKTWLAVATLAMPLSASATEMPAMELHRSPAAQVYFEAGRFPAATQQQFAVDLAQTLETAANRLGIRARALRHELHVYATAEAKVAAIGGRDGDRAITFTDDGDLALLARFGSNSVDERGPVLALLHQNWGAPAWDAVASGIARYARGTFRGQSLSAYARQIACEERPYSLYEVFRDEDLFLSNYVRDALAGAWITSVVEQHGTEVIESLYRAASPQPILDRLEVSAPEIEGAWEAWLTQRPCPDARQKRPLPGRSWRGVNFSHEPGRWRGALTPRDYTGYGSEKAFSELRKLKNLGANGIALVPYAFSRAPDELKIFYNLDERNDRVERSIAQAHSIGLGVMLKPQIWARGRFTGDLEFKSREDFDKWWRHYRRGLLHYARMAELHDVEILVVGTEWEGIMQYEDAWRGLITDIRRVYSGALTYAANWGREFEQLPFVDALDYAGVDFYYPLASAGNSPSAKSRRLAELDELLARHHERTGKPILFTEVGYPSLATAAERPWEEPDTELDPALQAACYRATIDAFADRPYLAGMFWWKWLSHGGEGRSRRGGFHPHGNPAMDVLADYLAGE